tara:strand:+ start:501 stop:1301 length:801 start_codon:yes stop_codon:yes gene_type:complete
MKHNKKRNTAFIYETLTRELTKAIINKDQLAKQKIGSLLKEFFSKGTVLAQELELYTILLETVNLHPKIAERLLNESKVAYKALNERDIFSAQSKIISAINKSVSTDVWGNFVPNFKSLASVSAIFNSKADVKKRVLFEQMIIDKMSQPTSDLQTQEMQPLDNLTYNSFIRKFNDKYSGLLSEQKDLLNRYVTSFADDGFELRLYLNEELHRLKGALSAHQDTSNQVSDSKIEEVVGYLEGFRKRDFVDTDLNKVLKTQELVRELV